ncbi:hypothetical protein QBC38DRAFT_478241 [Podospora fimiseda]|uniref:Uncharacterized protein n=1 Tax=Podospora fimiseda TaxID=252190 RepID=A0AAN7BP91_9PEZI|nr:hypothetical protein QBC38DRAFT_478241 [Podospora fimiseda]
MPGLTLATGANPAAAVPAASASSGRHRARSGSSPRTNNTAATTASRTSSPTRPPISPITPTLAPSQLAHNHNRTVTAIPPPTIPLGPPPPPISQAPKPETNRDKNNAAAATTAAIPDFALGRPAFTHSTHPAQQSSIPPPPAQPIIDFDNNPDVLALKSSIAILQLQRARATGDMQALSRAKEAALADPEAFIADLTAGRISISGGQPSLFGPPNATNPSSSDDEENEDDSSSDSDSDLDPEIKAEDGASPKRKRKNQTRRKGEGEEGPAAWRNLPKPQNIVRCPPINWSQYGVVGESLDKLHAEQVAAPTPGAPVVLGPGGTYEFKAGDSQAGASTSEKPQRLVGIAAPYVPGRDKLEKKGRGGRR